MKIYILVFIISLGLVSCGTITNLPGSNAGTHSGYTLTEADAAQGIREALDQGVGKGIAQLNKPDGFFGNNTYKLFLPPDAQKIENTFRQLGMGGMVDRAILQINRSAEDAVGYARPIFVKAIGEMTIADAINIIRGSNDAATQYFRQKTIPQLTEAFTPVIKSSLDKFSATKYYSDLINTYNNFPTTAQKLNPDLTSYVVDKAISALFDQIGQEEARIRANPRERTTQILKRVFGAQ